METAADIINDSLQEILATSDEVLIEPHEAQQGIRYTISESARREVLERLLELNHQRYEEEVKAGLHNKKNKKKGRKRR